MNNAAAPVHLGRKMKHENVSFGRRLLLLCTVASCVVIVACPENGPSKKLPDLKARFANFTQTPPVSRETCRIIMGILSPISRRPGPVLGICSPAEIRCARKVGPKTRAAIRASGG